MSHHAIGPFVAAADFVCLVILGAAAGVGYELWVKGVQFGRPIYLGLGCLAATLTVALLHSRGLYQRSFVLGPNLVAAILKVWVTVFALLAVAAFLIGISDHFSRGALLVYFAAGGATLIGVRRAAREVLSRAIAAGTLRGRRVLVIGDRNEISLGELGASLRHHGYSLISCFTFDPGKTPADLISQIPWSEVVDLGRKGSIDEVMLAVRWSDSERVDLILKMLRLLPISVRLLPDDAVAKLMRQPIADIGLARAVELQREPLKWWEQILKRKFDIVVASGALLLLLPLIVTVAVLIKLDSAGPVFFRQTRVGFNGRQFRIWKFRTMTTMEDGELVRQATKNDTRVTQVGRWLRATSVDEIPQLINVVTGDMSLVGPRPHAVAHDNQYDAAIANYAQRRHVKPGITGWAQVCGFRGETPTVDLMLRRVEHDLWYINNWSFWLDSMIVVRTAMVLMRRQNAY